MRDTELIKKLQRIGKPFYSIADLEKITGLNKDPLYVKLNRLQKRGVLNRITKGIYIVPDEESKLDKIASQLYFPSYLSFESALSIYGVLTLIPYALTFATVKKTKKITIMNRLVEFRQIKKGLFFGYEMQEGIYVAEPEKAFLDTLYFYTRGKLTLDIDELNLKGISRKVIFKYAKRFPENVKAQLRKLF